MTSGSHKLEAATIASYVFLNLCMSRPGRFQYSKRAANAADVTRNRRKENACGISLGTAQRLRKCIHSMLKCTVGIKGLDKWCKNTSSTDRNLDPKQNRI